MLVYQRITMATVFLVVVAAGCGGDKASEPSPVVDIVGPDVPPTYDTAVDIRFPGDVPPAQDTAPADTLSPPEPDTIGSDTAPPPPDTAPPKSVMSATIDEPAPDQVFEKGTSLTFKGMVSDSLYAPSMLTVEWASNKDGVLDTSAAAADGAVSFTTDALTPGVHLITLTITNPNGQPFIGGVEVSICQWAFPDKFDTNITGGKWKTYGDAFWDPGGWLEMTGNLQSKKGAIFNTKDYLTPGDVTLSFKIQTGPNVGYGADGFALSVFHAKDLPELESWIAAAKSGGGLGYGISGNYGPVVVEAFHVEIDTWHNVYDGSGNLHTDPTEANHIAITLNGDPGNHVLWAEVSNIEDMQWHDVTVKVEGAHVKVTLDGNTIIDDTVPDFDFRGGYIGFTGTTGMSTNYHRFDDLQILQECLVP